MTRIIVIPGSTRSGSHNVRLSGTITRELAAAGADVTRISLADYDMPIMNEDLEREKGIPENAKKLARLIDAQDGVMLVSPEYNGSIPTVLKNAIDWLSRNHGDIKPFRNRIFGLAACSPGGLGGIYVLSHLRQSLMSVGTEIITPQLAVGSANDAFYEDDTLRNERHRKILQNLVETLMNRANDYARI